MGSVTIMRKEKLVGFIDRMGWSVGRTRSPESVLQLHICLSLVAFEVKRMCHRETRSGRSQRAFSMISMDSFPCRIKSEMSSINDTIYLCNFRVSVDGDWLCLKELHELQSCEYPSRPAFLREEYGLSNNCFDLLYMFQFKNFYKFFSLLLNRGKPESPGCMPFDKIIHYRHTASVPITC